MLSRAKEGMYILGNAQSLEAYKKNDMWHQILTLMREQECVGTELEAIPVTSLHHVILRLAFFAQLKCQIHPESKTKISHWNQFDLMVGDGGCALPCEQQLPCGHICRRSAFASSDNACHVFTGGATFQTRIILKVTALFLSRSNCHVDMFRQTFHATSTYTSASRGLDSFLVF